jgi:hypothetical protein
VALRLPRGRPTLKRSGRQRDLILSTLAAAALVLFGLRVVLAALEVETWTLGWRVVNLPTNLVVRPLLRVGALERTLMGRLTIADVLAALLAWLAAMLLLATLANRRMP